MNAEKPMLIERAAITPPIRLTSLIAEPSARNILGCVIICLVAAPGCAYVESGRRSVDMAVGVAQHYRLQGLVQADIERQRIRRARCYSPLLTPATVSAAALDERLGPRWVDELLRDCPQFASFLSELTMRRAREAGVPLPMPAQPQPARAVEEGDFSPNSQDIQP